MGEAKDSEVLRREKKKEERQYSTGLVNKEQKGRFFFLFTFLFHILYREIRQKIKNKN